MAEKHIPQQPIHVKPEEIEVGDVVWDIGMVEIRGIQKLPVTGNIKLIDVNNKEYTYPVGYCLHVTRPGDSHD